VKISIIRVIRVPIFSYKDDNLELGIWNLEFGIWNLEFGIWK